MMSKKFSALLVIVFLLLFLSQIRAQETGTLRLLGGNMYFNLSEYPLSSLKEVQEEELVNGRFYRLAFFQDIPNRAQRQLLEQAGVKLLDYLPDLAYFVSIPAGLGQDILQSTGLLALVRPDAGLSLHPDLASGRFPDWSLPDDKNIDVMVSFHGDLDAASALALLETDNLMRLPGHEYPGLAALRLPRTRLSWLAELPYISWVEPIYPPSEPENYTGKTLHRSNVLDASYMAGRKYDGSGINVMLQDDGIIGPHIDYQGRIGSQNLVNNSGDHGDHIAGTIMGAGNLDPRAKGMAPGATIHTFGASPTYPGFVGMYNHYNNLNIRITSTSYSNGCNAGYTTLARSMDQHIRELPYLMHVFSAGNDGTSNCGYGAGSGWGNITGGHKAGKNVIAVANLNYTDGLSTGSSRGPAHDGRIKPDISAKGSSVVSTTNPNLYTTKSGTSMSCPGVSGTLAQLYHAYISLNNGQEPYGGLMKAIVLNTADDLDNPGPDFKTGWGRINARRAVETIEQSRFFTDSISQGDTNYHTLQIPANVTEYRIMVYWTDYEAFAGVSKALVNDLDAVLFDSNQVANLPWRLDHTPNPVLLNTPAVKGIDNLNNVEQISISNPLPGEYTLRVTGALVPHGPQSYFVVYESLNDELKLTYPLGGESFAPGESITIRWDAHGETLPFHIEFSADDGLSWTTISNSVVASRRYLDWTLPFTFTGKMKVRVSRGGKSSESEQAFSIMGIPQGININWACKNAFSVSWNPIAGANGYIVYKLGNMYMDSVGTTTSTSFIISGISENETHWVTVSALGPDQALGRRAIAISKVPGIWNCVFEYDATVEILSPAPGIHPVCIGHSTVPVKVRIYNIGQHPLANFPVSFSLNFAGTLQGTYPDTIHPGNFADYTFGQTINLPLPGNYFISASVSHPSDSNTFNDEFVSKVRLVQGTSMTSGSLEDFESFTSCSVISECDFTCNLSNGWWNEDNSEFDDADWRALEGITPTSGTGPIGDHSTTTGNGTFLYIEASGNCFQKTAKLISPCLDLMQMALPVLEFWYNMNGANMGRLHLDLLDGAEWIEDIIPPVIGNQGQAWKKAVVDLQSYAGKKIAIRFRGITGNGQLSDIAIDDVLLSDATSIQELNQHIVSLNVYPNPARESLYVDVHLTMARDMNLRLFDMAGRELTSERYTPVNGHNHLVLPVNGIAPGTYLLQFMTDQAVRYTKIQIQ